ncbi:N-6 DNA methylase [Vibrio metschnikovii]
MKFEEFQQEIDWWYTRPMGSLAVSETKQAWKVSIEDIIERNFNLDIKNPYQDEVVSHDPEELLANYQQQQQDIKALRDQLKGILGDALSSTIQDKKQAGEQ